MTMSLEAAEENGLDFRPNNRDTTNTIEGLNAPLLKTASNIKVSHHRDAVTKILCLTNRNLTNKWTKKNDWAKVRGCSLIKPAAKRSIKDR